MEILANLDPAARSRGRNRKTEASHFGHKLRWVLCRPGAPICAHSKIPHRGKLSSSCYWARGAAGPPYW